MDLHEFESLDPAEQEKIFHQKPFKEKGELLMHSHNPAALTRSLSQEELYLVTRDMDTEERGEIIKYATLPQLFFLSDIDCWKKDRIEAKSFIQWLETLLIAGDQQLLTWFASMDYEFLVSGFQNIIQVQKPDHEWTADEVLGDTPYFTIDQMYYIVVHEENLETVKRALEILFVNLKGRYFAVLEGVLGEMADEVEEGAFHQREIRLTERGFHDLETAQKIYRPLSKEEFEQFPLKKVSDPLQPREVQGALPNYTVLWSADRFFLDDVLHSFQDDTTGTREKLQEELAWISNKVIACEGLDLSSEIKVRRGIERARYFINIGLEDLSGCNFDKARRLLEERWLEIIFRWGASKIFEIKREAGAVLKKYWKNQMVDFLGSLDSPMEMVFAGFFRPIPQIYEADAPGKDPFRDFKAFSDVESALKIIKETEIQHQSLAKRKK